MDANKLIEDSFKLWAKGVVESEIIDKEKVNQLLRLAESYHQSKVNNVVLDDVIKCNHNWNYHLLGFERICTICKEVDMIDNVL